LIEYGHSYSFPYKLEPNGKAWGTKDEDIPEKFTEGLKYTE
jgi:hypothetical protein